MKSPLPTIKELVTKVSRRAVDQALAFLLGKRALLKPYVDVEDLVFQADLENDARFAGIEHNFLTVRSAVARQLWGYNVFISVSVIDSLLFQSIVHTDATDPIRLFFEKVRGLGLHRPGLVLYPIHSMGLIAGGLLQWSGAYAVFRLPQFGLAVTPQTNNFDRTLRFLQESASALGIQQSLPNDLMRHWRRSRPTAWLERNPLMLARIRSYPGGSYYENQPFLAARLRLGTGLVLLASAMQPEAIADDDRRGILGSSRRMNNFQTLDLRHYFVFYPKPGRRAVLDGQCIPMNANRLGLAEMSELPIDLDPRHWKRRTKSLDRACQALEKLGALYASQAIFIRNMDARGRTARRLFTALNFFKRSYRQSFDGADAIINLAIATESLLTDSYADGVAPRMRARLGPLIRTLPRKDRNRLLGSLETLYKGRNQFVHSGSTTVDVDLSASRRAFAHAFIGICERLDRLPRESGAPIHDIIGA